MSNIFNNYNLKGYKSKGGKCCGTCKYSRHMFGGLYVCVKNDNNSSVTLLSICDEYEKYGGK